jgi:hypothetical protein
LTSLHSFPEDPRLDLSDQLHVGFVSMTVAWLAKTGDISAEDAELLLRHVDEYKQLALRHPRTEDTAEWKRCRDRERCTHVLRALLDVFDHRAHADISSILDRATRGHAWIAALTSSGAHNQ